MFHTSLRAAIALALICFASMPVGAWGQTGHRIIARIAEQHLTPKTKAAVDALLGPRGMAWASTWADEIKGDPKWRHASPWHYINLGDDEAFADVKRNPDGDVVSAMKANIETLENGEAARTDKIHALRFLIHFVGDLHQPLHAGRAEDRGGNSIRVEWFGEPTNLHRVWDTHIIRQMELSYSEYADFLDHAEAGDIAKWQASGFIDWVEEGRKLRPLIYGFDKASEGELPDLRYGYLDRARPVVEQRLLMGGVRLAGILNGIFDAQ